MVLCVGEILVDCFSTNINGESVFIKKAGGAPFNLSCAIAKTGGDAFFVGSVGDDLFGNFLEKTAKEQLGENYFLAKRTDANTTLALVENDENGERSFCFYRHSTADYKMPVVADQMIEKSNIVHIGSLMLSESEGLSYAVELAKRVKKLGKKVSFDVNYRSDIFSSVDEAKKAFVELIALSDIVKFSEEEVEIFGRDFVYSMPDKLVFITLGGRGSKYLFAGEEKTVPSIKVKPVDTCGAGDAFYGACLSGLDKGEPLFETVKRANIVGALTTQKTGAIDAIPTLEEVSKYLEK